jgi:anti-sigma factor RsiW
MSKPSPLTEQERADLVAYLDGELTGEAARTVEARLRTDPDVRAEAESLQRTWDLLDELPNTQPSGNFTQATLSRLALLPQRSWLERLHPLLLGVGWAAVLLLAAAGGYLAFRTLPAKPPGEPELIRDLRVIENKRYYDLVDDLDFLRKLDDPDLFGDDNPPW